MNREQLIERLISNHNEAAAFITSLNEEEFMLVRNNKWTAGQQLSHLILCLQPIGQALQSADYIRGKFGTVNRQLMDYDQVIATYKTGLQNGGKAPERFIPPAIAAGEGYHLRQELNEVLSTIKNHLQSYSETDMDTLGLPHPFLGLLTIRELLYLMSHHPHHHLEQVKVNLKG